MSVKKILIYAILILGPFALLEGGVRVILWGYERWINPFEDAIICLFNTTLLALMIVGLWRLDRRYFISLP